MVRFGFYISFTGGVGNMKMGLFYVLGNRGLDVRGDLFDVLAC